MANRRGYWKPDKRAADGKRQGSGGDAPPREAGASRAGSAGQALTDRLDRYVRGSADKGVQLRSDDGEETRVPWWAR